MNKFITYTEGLTERIFSEIQSSTRLPLWHSSVFRVFFGLFILVVSTPTFRWIGDVPKSFFNPPLISFARLLQGFPTAGLLYVLDIIIVLLLVFITIGIRARISSLVFGLIYILGNSFKYSFGKIDHGEIMLVAVLFCFSFSNWGTKNALIPDKHLPFHYFSSVLLAILLSFGMFTAGFEKLVFWVDFDLNTSGFLRWFYPGYFNLERQHLLADLVFLFPPLLLEILDYSAVVFELSPFLCLLAGSRFWKSWLLIACVFHLANTCLLNIMFILHIPVYFSFFLYPLLDQAKHENSTQTVRFIRFAYVLAILIGILHIAYRLSGNGVYSIFISSDIISKLWLNVALWVGMIVLGSLSLLSEKKSLKYLKANY